MELPSASKRQRKEDDQELGLEALRHKRLGEETSKDWKGTTRDIGQKAEDWVTQEAKCSKYVKPEEVFHSVQCSCLVQEYEDGELTI